MNNTIAYQPMDTFHLPMRDRRFRNPVFPSVIAVKIIPAAAGPISIIGNISNPSILDIACPLKSFGATKIKAPDHEMMNVEIK